MARGWATPPPPTDTREAPGERPDARTAARSSGGPNAANGGALALGATSVSSPAQRGCKQGPPDPCD